MFVKWVSSSLAKEEELRLEGLWVLTNLASGPSACIKDMIKHDAVQCLVRLLNPENNHEVYIYSYSLFIRFIDF